MTIYTHLDLFSGIGGFALAASRVWPEHKVIAFCEIDGFCQKVLQKHWPDVPIIPDVKDIYGMDYANTNVDLLTAGIPCQPHSLAGKRRGRKDDRWLWPECHRIIRETQPEQIILENVPGLLTSDNGMAFNQVLADLADAGYETQTFIIPACGVNAPHRRDRVWIVAHSEQFGRGRRNNENDPGENRKIQTSGSCSAGEYGVLADSHSKRQLQSERGKSQERQRACDCRGNVSVYSRTGRTGLADCCGKSDNRQSQPRLGGTSSGISARMDGYWDGDWERGIPRTTTRKDNRADRLKALGNSIVPQVAIMIMTAINNDGFDHGRRM